MLSGPWPPWPPRPPPRVSAKSAACRGQVSASIQRLAIAKSAPRSSGWPLPGQCLAIASRSSDRRLMLDLRVDSCQISAAQCRAEMNFFLE